jgi:hypothetical protein
MFEEGAHDWNNVRGFVIYQRDKIFREISSAITGVFAVIVAERGLSSIRPSSPKISLGCKTARVTFFMFSQLRDFDGTGFQYVGG